MTGEMIDDRVLDMIHRSVEGRLTSGEQGELERYLQANPSANKLRAELLSLHRAIKSVKPVPPPTGFSDAIMAQISSRAPHSVRAGQEPLDITPTNVHTQRDYRSNKALNVTNGLVFAAGLAAGIACFALYSGTRDIPGAHDDSDSLSGTMLIESRAAQSAEGTPQVEFALSAAKGRFIFKQVDERLQILFSASADSPIRVKIKPNQAFFLTNWEQGEQSLRSLTYSEEAIEFSETHSGSQTFEMNPVNQRISIIQLSVFSGAESWQDTVKLAVTGE